MAARLAISVTLAALAAASAPGQATRPFTFAKSVERAVNARDRVAVNALVDRQALARRSVDGLDLSVGERLAALRGLQRTVDLGAMLTDAIGTEGHCRLLDIRDHGLRVLLRAVDDRGAVNYYDLRIDLSADGPPRVLDAYAYRSGEWLSDVLRRGCRRDLLAARGWQELIEPAANMDRIIERGWYERGLRLFHTLPGDLRADRTLLLQRLVCAGHVSRDEVERAWAEFRQRFPDDPAADLFLLPHLAARGDPEGALTAIDRIRRAVYDDPWLDAVAARALLATGSLDRAAAHAQRLLDAEPELEPTWTLQLRVSLARREHERTAHALSVLEDRFGYRFQNLEGLEDFEAYVESEAYLEERGEPAHSFAGPDAGR